MEDNRQQRRDFVDKANSAVYTFQKAKFFVKLAKAVRSVVLAAEAAAAAPEILLAIVIIVIIALLILTAVLVGGGFEGKKIPGPTTPNTNPVPGLELHKAGPGQVQNGENISYNIDGTYTGTNEVVLSEDIPNDTSFVSASGNPEYGTVNNLVKTVSWSFKKNGILDEPGLKSFSFSLIVKPTKDDIWVVNTVSARSDAPSSPNGGSSGNSCTQPYEGKGFCSVEYLKKTFNSDAKALIASLICESESGSNPLSINTKCPDYSVGLFQINLIVHCAGAYDSSNYAACILVNRPKRDVCESTLVNNPDENINSALRISNSGTNWQPWTTWSYKGKYPAAKETLTKCGISY